MGLIVTGLLLPVFASAESPTTQSILDAANAKGKAEKKNVLVIFHASWCGWCKKLDAFLEQPQFKKTFDQSFVVTHIDVMENGPQKTLENAGGVELMTKLGGATAGLPFFAVLSPKGEKLGDSFMANKQNIGFPSEPGEVTAFMAMLKQTAPKMSDAQRTSVENFLRKPASK